VDRKQNCVVVEGGNRSVLGCWNICSVEEIQEGSQGASLAYSRLCLVVIRCFRIVFYLKFYQTGLHKSVCGLDSVNLKIVLHIQFGKH